MNTTRNDNGKIYKLPEHLVITCSEKRAKIERSGITGYEKAGTLREDKSKIKAGNKRGDKK